MNESLRVLVDLRQTIQKSRIQFGNRLSAIERDADEGDGELFERWHERFAMLEKELDKDIALYGGNLPIVGIMVCVKGVGPLLAAKVVSQIDITRPQSVSALWRYAGFGVVDGHREKPVKGEKLHYNRTLKTTCYLIGSSFLKSSSPYRQLYDQARARYETTKPDWTKLHRHNAAMGYMIKIWLSHLWEVWRTLEGLPTREPYAHDYLEHPSKYTPQEFGWPEL